MKYSILRMSMFVMLLGLGCNEPYRRQTPSIAEDKMVRIHADVLIANAAVANLYGPLRDSMLQVYQSQIFTMNGVSKAEYEASLRIYADNMESMDSLYAKTRVILDSLERIKLE